MTLNTELPAPIEHKLHRLHHQHHFHHHHHHVHHLMHHHNHHLHLNNNTVIHELDTDNSLNHQHHDHHQHHQNSIIDKLQQDNQLVKSTRQLTTIVAPRRNEQQLATPKRHSINSTQRSQIRFFLFAAFAYILSPIDLIPEVIFGVFGIIDDLLFLLMCLFCIAIIIIYPIFREMQRSLLRKLGLKGKLMANDYNKRF